MSLENSLWLTVIEVCVYVGAGAEQVGKEGRDGVGKGQTVMHCCRDWTLSYRPQQSSQADLDFGTTTLGAWEGGRESGNRDPGSILGQLLVP